MLKLVTSRILASVPLLLLVAFLSFVLLELANRGTDPAARIAGDGASPEQIETIRQATASEITAATAAATAATATKTTTCRITTHTSMTKLIIHLLFLSIRQYCISFL